MELTKVAQDNLGDKVAAQLREMIVLRRVPPGEHLAEESLAAQFGVSRGPVRNALRQLAAEGLVEIISKRVRVREFGDRDIHDLYRLRAALETLAVDDVLNRGASVNWADLEGAIASMSRSADALNPVDFAIADLAFHQALYEASGNHRLLTLWQQLQPTFALLVSITTARDVDLHPSRDSHREILQLVRAGDGATAKVELTQHLLGALNRMVQTHQEVVLSHLAKD